MATIKDFKIEIAKLAKKQKECKACGAQWEQYMNRGILHAMYTAYYILKHNEPEYMEKALLNWSRREQGWRGCSFLNAEKQFKSMTLDFVTKYGETICTD